MFSASGGKMTRIFFIVFLLAPLGCSKNNLGTNPNGGSTFSQPPITIVSGFSGKDTIIISPLAQWPTTIGTYDLSSFDSLKLAFIETAMPSANQYYTINFEIGPSCLRQDTISPPATRNYSSIIHDFEITSSTNVWIYCNSWVGSIKLTGFSIIGWRK